MTVIIHNRRLDDSITFNIDELSEESKADILSQVRGRGWDDSDCWSEVIR